MLVNRPGTRSETGRSSSVTGTSLRFTSASRLAYTTCINISIDYMHKHEPA